MSYFFTPLIPGDEPLLEEAFFLGIYVPPDQRPLSREVMREPFFKRYIKNWGQPGDIGLKVMANKNDTFIGAAWVRRLKGENSGYGYVDDQTPELCVSMIHEYRNQRIGTNLLKTLFEKMSQNGYRSVSLSVSLANPAKRLYERLGFTPVGETYDDSVTMIKYLKSDPSFPRRRES